MTIRHGIPPEVWAAAKQQAYAVMSACRRGGFVTYGETASSITACHVEAYDPRLYTLIGEISKDEVEAGRPMLSAIVVHKTDNKPGAGFFKWARELGVLTGPDTESNRTRFWVDECCKIWRTR